MKVPPMFKPDVSSKGNPRMEPLKIHAAADHLICLAHFQNRFLSPAKIQQLLYFSQGWYLGFFGGRTLFENNFQAWVHGPVNPEIHHRFSGLYSPLLTALDLDALFFRSFTKYRVYLCENDLRHIEQVYRSYVDYSSYQMEHAFKQHAPWKANRAGFGADEKGWKVISKDQMQSFFRDSSSDSLRDQLQPESL